ncbi:Protein of unknown function [Bacillus mycoides]|nr:Protein of unknown function [Bacillus mycoides]
MDYPHEK